MRSKGESGRFDVRVEGVGKFGKWMEFNMKNQNLTTQLVADMLHVTRQRVMSHIKQETYADFPNVVAYCWVFNVADDPHRIYELVKEDWR